MTTPLDVPTTAMEIYKLLQPLDSEARKLAISGALAMLGETGLMGGKQQQDAGGDDDRDYPRRATTWMKQNGITGEHLSHVFHDGEVIAAKLPGTHKKEKAINTYILCGIGQLLKTGEPKVDDAGARQACKSHGCLDQANHSVTVKGARQMFTGSKKLGWTLTAPGLKQGADLVKQLAQG